MESFVLKGTLDEIIQKLKEMEKEIIKHEKSKL